MVVWYVYIIQTKDHKLYTGITTDVERRFQQHKSQKQGAKFFRAHVPEKIVHVESYEDRSSASKREYEIKRMGRQKKLALFIHSASA